MTARENKAGNVDPSLGGVNQLHDLQRAAPLPAGMQPLGINGGLLGAIGLQQRTMTHPPLWSDGSPHFASCSRSQSRRCNCRAIVNSSNTSIIRAEIPPVRAITACLIVLY
jgi:hypothetical protein